MRAHLPPIPATGTVSISTDDIRPGGADRRGLATRDREVIKRWAQRHGAEPATGEATASGPATIDVNDGGAGVRFNFPGAARFRPISWDEWFDNMDRHHLVFIYEEDTPDRAHDLWQRRGGDVGQGQEDWFDAERQLRQSRGGQGAYYQFIQQIPEP